MTLTLKNMKLLEADGRSSLLTVLYRLCSVGNPNKGRPINPKMKLMESCYHSFIESFSNVADKVHFIVDKPSYELMEMIEGCPINHEIETSNHTTMSDGNTATFHRQLNLACDVDKVLLLEDDYYFLPDAGKIIDEALDELDFITPYDHPGYYNEEEHNYPKEVVISAGRHWQSVKSTCLTFATRGGNIKKEIDCMKSYGWADHPMWCDLTQRWKLWSPIPSLATHMETEFLAPLIDWRNYYE